jgi:hypothetical protein
LTSRVKDLPRLTAAIVGVLAVVWALVVVTARGDHHTRPFAEQANIARHLVLGHGFTSPMDAAPDAPPSAWSPPLYPLIIAAAYRLFGLTSQPAVVALLVLNALCFAAIVIATQAISTRLFQSQVPGLIAAGVLAVHPVFRAGMGDFWDGFLALAMFAWLTARALRLDDAGATGTTMTLAGAAGFGAGLGLLALTNASYITTFPVLLFMACRGPIARARLVAAGVAIAACLAVITPWTIRNYAALGRWVPIRTGAGVQFWIGNPPVSHGWLDQPAFAVHPYANPSERALMLQIGEPAYDDLVFERFERATLERPLGYLASCLRRSAYLLIGNPTKPGRSPLFVGWESDAIAWRSLVFAMALAILGIGGMFMARRSGYGQHGLPLLAATVGLPFVFSAMIDRYSLPLRWLLAIYAGGCIWLVASQIVGADLRVGPGRTHGSAPTPLSR